MVGCCWSCVQCQHLVYLSQATLCSQPSIAHGVETSLPAAGVSRRSAMIRTVIGWCNACFPSLLVVLGKLSWGSSTLGIRRWDAVFSSWWLSSLGDSQGFLSLSGFHRKRETPAYFLFWMDSLMWLSCSYHGYLWGGDSSSDGFKSLTGCCIQLWCLLIGQNHSPSGEGCWRTYYTSSVSFLGASGRTTFGWWELNVVLWFDEKNLHSLMHLNTWPLNDGTVWEGYEMSKRWSLLEEVPGGGHSCSLSFSASYVQTKDDHPAS